MSVVDFSGLRDSLLFKGLADKELDLLAKLFSAHKVSEGKTVFVENMPGEALYIIKNGTVRISQMLSENNEKILVVLGAGEIFGELAVIDGDTRVTSARVSEDAVIYSLKRKEFMTLLSEHPRLGAQLTLNLARSMSAKMRLAKKEYRSMLTTLSKMKY